jgi:hypothetical protein
VEKPAGARAGAGTSLKRQPPAFVAKPKRSLTSRTKAHHSAHKMPSVDSELNEAGKLPLSWLPNKDLVRRASARRQERNASARSVRAIHSADAARTAPRDW